MLVLTCKTEESVMIGDCIEVKVLKIKGDSVRIGVAAPKSIPVDRRVIYEKKKMEESELNQTSEV